jgi:hypothetical protein
MLQLGATLAITASLPLSSLVPDTASWEDKLFILRKAVEAGQVELWRVEPNRASAPDAVFDQFDNKTFDDSFDNRQPRK